MIIMKRLIIGIVVCLLIASCIVILPITSTVANRLGETDGILTCSVTKKQSSQTTSPVIWDKETFAAFYSLAQTVNATFHGADPHMEYPLEETSYTLYLEHPQGESDLLVLTEGNLLFYHGLRYTLDSNALFSFLKEHALAQSPGTKLAGKSVSLSMGRREFSLRPLCFLLAINVLFSLWNAPKNFVQLFGDFPSQIPLSFRY